MEHADPTGKVVWLILGFNIGFIGTLLVAILTLPLFGLQRASADPVSYMVVSLTPTASATATETPLPTATLPPPTMDVGATSTAERVAFLAQATATPTLTPSPWPTETRIPPTSTPLPPPPAYQLTGIQWYRQGWNNCGPANLAMGLSFYDWTGTQEDTASYLKPDREDKNVTPQQMADYVNQYTNLRAIWRAAGELDQIRWLIANEFAVIIESGYEPPGEGWFGHYETVVAYDETRDTFTVYDSYLGTSSRPTVVHTSAKFDRNWQAFNRNYIVIYPPNREKELQAFLGQDWLTRANYQKAAEIARQEAADDPDNPFAWFNMGTSLTTLGRYEEAVTAYRKALDIGLPYRMLWYQFNIYEAFLQTGRLDDVLSLANDTLRTTPYVEETYYYKGRVYEIQQNFLAAQQQYNEAVTRNPNYTQANAALQRIERYI